MRQYTAFLLAFFSVAVFAANPIVVKKAELTKVTDQITHLQKTINQALQQGINLEQQLQNADTDIDDLHEEIASLTKAITHEQLHLTKLKKSHQVLLGKLTDQHNMLSQQIRAAYQLGQLQSLKILLNQDDPNVIQRHMTYYRYLMQAKLNSITKIKDTLDTLQSNMQAITQQQNKLKSLLAKNKTQQEQLQFTRSKRQALIAELHKEVQTKQQQLTSLLANQKALHEVITRLKLQAANGIYGRPFKQLQGKLHWPAKGMIAANFGSSLDVGDQHLNGVILKVPQGSPIRAVSSGKVIFANWLRGFGLLVIINHGNNYMSLYARNQALRTKVGDLVSTGDVIANAGSNNGSEKANIYFEIRQNGSPINPHIWCS